jgi:hypothetical protein
MLLVVSVKISTAALLSSREYRNDMLSVGSMVRVSLVFVNSSCYVLFRFN